MRRIPIHGLCVLATLSCLAAPARAESEHPSLPDDHAPIGVMGDHLHAAGEVMLSYRYGRMHMDHNYDSTAEQDPRAIVAPGNPGGFRAVPVDMKMERHMLGAMFAPHDRVTLMTMVPLVRVHMDHLRRDGVLFATEADGLGDIQASALVSVFESGPHRIHLNAGLSVPTGSIREEDSVPGMPPSVQVRQRLPYPMQLGSGTWDLLPGFTYLGRDGQLTWGAQAIGTLRTGRNSAGYRLGDRIGVTAWSAFRLTHWLSVSARAEWSAWENIHGSDPVIDLARGVVPTADPNLRGGDRLELLGGFNLLVPLGKAGSHRFALELGWPAYQRLDGPQLGTDFRLIFGWQQAFKGLIPGFDG